MAHMPGVCYLSSKPFLAPSVYLLNYLCSISAGCTYSIKSLRDTHPALQLLRHPGAGKLQMLRPSYLDFKPLRHHPLMGRAHYRPDGTRHRTQGELEARAKKKAQRAQEEAEAAAAAPLEEAEHGAGAGDMWPEGRADAEEEEVEIEVEVEEAAEEPPVRHRPKARLRPAPKWGAESPDDSAGPRARARHREREFDSRSRSPRRMELSAERIFSLSKALTAFSATRLKRRDCT